MLSINFSQFILYFTLFSFVGWVLETAYCSVVAHKLVYRGFLSGPYCPIYGFGAIAILIATLWCADWPIVVFLISVAISAVFEYFTGWLLEKLFLMRWWDYSHRKFNIRGRICLTNTVLFGVLGLAAVYLLVPLFHSFVELFKPQTQRVLGSFMVVVFLGDLIRSLSSVAGLKDRVEAIYRDIREYDWGEGTAKILNATDIIGSLRRLRARTAALIEYDEENYKLHAIDETIARVNGISRVLKAYPYLLIWRLERSRYTKAADTAVRTPGWFFVRRAGIARELKSAYEGIAFSRMVWVFLMGCVIGYVVETLVCFVNTGVIESRQGMLYGPFSQIYGFGAVLMILLLIPLARRGMAWLFVGSMIVGGLFEMASSYIQEWLFHTRSWEYSSEFMPLFGGRTSPKFMLLWGIMGMLYIRLIYPKMLDIINRIQPKIRQSLTWMIVISLSLNLALTCVALNRWTSRQIGNPPRNGFEEFIDDQYPNDVMAEVFPTMVLTYEVKSLY